MSLIGLIKSNIRHKVTKSIGWQGIMTATRTVFALASAVLLTRYFGPEDFGFYSFVLALIGIFTRFTRGGSDNVAIKHFTKSPESKAEIFTAIALWRTTCWFIGACIIFACAIIFADDRYYYALLIYGFMFFSIADFLDSFFQSRYESHIYIIARIAVELASFIAKVLCVIWHLDIAVFFYILCTQNLTYALLIVALYKLQKTSGPTFKFSKPWIQKIIKESLPLIFAAFMVAFYIRVDHLMLGYIAGDIALGLYAPSSQISIALFSMAVIFVHPLQVRFAEYKHNTPQYNQWLEYYINITTKLSLILCLSITIIAPVFIPLLFGAEFKATAPILMIQIWACVFSYHGAIRTREVVNNYKSHYNLIGVSIGALTNVCLNLILIPQFQGQGAALATVISMAVANYGTSWLIPDLRPFAKTQTKALCLLPAQSPAKKAAQ